VFDQKSSKVYGQLSHEFRPILKLDLTTPLQKRRRDLQRNLHTST